ncbi:MAG: PorT family protein [Microscillaceae bacterium]|nr:PorT family protein [Microscillaceae bacterium]MDW8460149.1 porin family protein [Cytophagales bacterium]
MKKNLIFLALYLVIFSNANAQTRFGIRAGLNLADINGKTNGVSYNSDTEIRIGFHLGGIIDIALAEKSYFQPGLLFSSKGSRAENSSPGVTTTSNTNLGYLEIPLNIGYRVNAGSNKLLLTAGPYLGLGITGTVTTKVTTGNVSVKETRDVEWGNSANSTLKPLDFGVNLGIGTEFSNFQVNLQYGLGLSNNRPKGNSDNTSRNSVISISLGYFFGSRK